MEAVGLQRSVGMTLSMVFMCVFLGRSQGVVDVDDCLSVCGDIYFYDRWFLLYEIVDQFL